MDDQEGENEKVVENELRELDEKSKERKGLGGNGKKERGDGRNGAGKEPPLPPLHEERKSASQGTRDGSPLRRPGQPSRCVAVCTSAEETAREGETHEGESGFEAELRSSHRVGALFTSPALLSSPDAIDGGRRREEKRGLAVVAGEPNRCRSGLSERENANRGQAGEPPLLFAIPTVLPITSAVWNCAALPGCRGTPFSSPEEHCCGHLSRVEGERATGGRRTWPSSPLSPETATESSVLVRISESKGLLSLLCKLMLRHCGVVHHRVVDSCLYSVLGVVAASFCYPKLFMLLQKCVGCALKLPLILGGGEKDSVKRLGYEICILRIWAQKLRRIYLVIVVMFCIDLAY
ncbi:uncharacterized protein [Arachis hypogaea]|uniref:uncharacterized protein n=1 Tax=Arachis hypogaea TaxID=3818 RepID=UPI003B22070D